MITLPARPERRTVTPDGRVLHPCGCIDVPDSLARRTVRRFVVCLGHSHRPVALMRARS